MVSSTKRNNKEYRNNKFQRPFAPDHALHVVLGSELAKGPLSFLHPSKHPWLKEYVPALATQLNIRIYGWSINSNHIHLIVKAPSRELFQRFLRTLSSRIACIALRARKGYGKTGQFFLKRPYSRILTWGREFENVLRYVSRNLKEARGDMPYTPRDDKAQMRKLNISLDQEAVARNPQLVLLL